MRILSEKKDPRDCDSWLGQGSPKKNCPVRDKCPVRDVFFNSRI